jgi:exonuclease III
MQQPNERVASHVACYSLNLRGLRSPEQVAAVVAWAEESEHDVLFFQETHLRTAPFDFVRQQRGSELLWHGQQWYAPGNGRTGGCWVLVKRKACLTGMHCVDLQNVAHARGRVLRVDGLMDSHPVSLVCVYAPADPADRVAFMDTTLPACLPARGERHVLVGGDLNTVTHALDYVGVDERVGRSRARKADARALLAMSTHAGLVDVWRRAHPHDAAMTHFSAGTHSGARLDRWLLSSPDWAVAAEHGTVTPLPTDHRPVTLRLALPDAVHMGPGLPRVSPASFDAPHIEAAVKAAIEQARQRQQQGPANPAGHPTFHRDNWQRLKSEAFSKVHECERDARAAARRRQAEWCDAAAAAAAQLEGLARDAQASGEQVAEAARAAREMSAAPAHHHRHAVRDRLLAGATLLHTQQNTSSFYQFNKPGREPRPPTYIRSLVVAEGQPALDLTTPAGSAAAVEAFAAHYSADSPAGVFAARPVDLVARERLLAAGTPRLAPELAAAAEGPDADSLVTVDDLYRAMWTSARNKAPGPDGLTLEFYLKFWERGLGQLLKAALDEAFLDLRLGECPLQAFLMGIVTLVAKPKKPKNRIKGYRPITLLDVDTRLVAKALATRLQIPLDLVISSTQTAFIAGRDITDNVHYHLALADYVRDRQPGVWMLLMDLAGAYDNVNWGLLRAAMQAVGLRDAGHVRWAQLLHRGAALRVAVNGHLSEAFPMASGLLQGSGASPVYWTIVLQPLSAYLASLAAAGRVHTPVVPQARVAQGPVTEEAVAPDSSFADDVTAAVLQDMQAAPGGEAGVLGGGQLDQPAAGGGMDPPAAPAQPPVGSLAGAAPAAAADAHPPGSAAQGAAQPAEPRGTDAVVAAFGLFHVAGGPPLSLGDVDGKSEAVLAQPPAPAGIPALPGFRPRAANDPVRFLGVPFAPAAPNHALAAEAFKGRAQTIRETGKSWLSLRHALWGRVVIAMQCLASKPIYQLAFFKAPKADLQEMQAALRAYVATSSDPRDASPVSGLVYPCEAAMAMPPHEGGLGYPVLATFQVALLARLVAQLVGPRARPWQGLVRRFLQDPELGVASWVVTQPTAMRLPLGMQRLQACVDAFAALGVTRIVAPDEQPFHSIMAEPLFWNPAIQVPPTRDSVTGLALSFKDAVSTHQDAQVRAWRYLRDVYATLHTGPQPVTLAVHAAVGALLPALPEPWRHALHTFPPPASEWECALVPAGTVGGVLRPAYVARRAAAAGDMQWVLDTGRMVHMLPGGRPPIGQGALELDGLQWQPAHVVSLPAIDQRLTTEQWMDQRLPPRDRPERPQEAWLVGPWAHVWLDSEVWGLPRAQQPTPLTCFSVKLARGRLTAAAWAASRRQRATGGAPYSQGLGIYPKLWGKRPWLPPPGQEPEWDPDGINALERGWAEEYAAARAGEQQQRDLLVGGRPPGEHDAADMRADMQLVNPPPRPKRPSPEEREVVRAARRAAARAPPDGVQQPPDPVPNPDPAPQPAPVPDHGRAVNAVSVWARTRALPLPHFHRTAAWRMLHGVLMVRALRLRLLRVTRPATADSASGCCQACLAAGRGRHLETLTHTFITCPSVAPALTWLRAVVQALLGEAPPLDPLVLIADAPWRWRLADDALWGTLRVAYLGSVWHLRESETHHPGPAAVIDEVVATVRHSVMRDASRIDGVELGDAGGPPIPAVWFRGPEPKLDQEDFDALWPNSGDWYQLQPGPAPVHVRLSAAWPVPFPVPAAALPPPALALDQAVQWVNPEEIPLDHLEEEVNPLQGG